jgi:hypothetical protein
MEHTVSCHLVIYIDLWLEVFKKISGMIVDGHLHNFTNGATSN